MAKPSKPVKVGLTPGKAVMIGVLTVVLLVVIVTQFGGQKKQVAAIKPRARRTAARRADSASSAASTAPAVSAVRSGKPWPKFDLAQVAASNPFELPDVLVNESEDATSLTPGSEAGEDEGSVAAMESDEVREMRLRQSEFLASLRASGVDMILRSPRGSVARIGDLSLRVGDVHEGLRVAEIGASGVVFAPQVTGDVESE